MELEKFEVYTLDSIARYLKEITRKQNYLLCAECGITSPSTHLYANQKVIPRFDNAVKISEYMDAHPLEESET